jgi:4-hydroxy-2-oxoheptanedioate aldolase
LRPNTTKAKLKAGETVFGSFVRYPDASLVEVQGYLGWDFLIFDAEHGTLEPRDAEHLVRAAELRNVTPLVRVTTNAAPTILRLLDTGIQGAHVPWINTADEAERAVRAIKYHPRGNRGLAGVRAADFAQGIPLGEYIQQANAETLVVLQIESPEALEELPSIAAVNDVDVIFVGPTDLSHSLGLAGQIQHPTVQATIQKIIDVVMKSNVAFGILAGSAAAAREWRARGARYIVTTIESVMAPAVKEYLKQARS